LKEENKQPSIFWGQEMCLNYYHLIVYQNKELTVISKVEEMARKTSFWTNIH